MNREQDAGCPDLVSLLDRIGRHADEAAFEQLFRHYYPRLCAYMQSVGVNRRVAEELVQETLLKVWTKAGYYRPTLGPPSAWVFTIARNVRSDDFRRRKDIDVTTLPFLEVSPADTDGQASRVDALAIIERLNDLSDEQKTVVELTFLDGLSQTEISSRLRVPLGTVKSRVRLAFKNLRRMLGIES